jgi:release factor glutamine methyltransferase
VNWRPLYREAAERLGSPIDARRIVSEAASGAWPALLDETVSDRAAGYYRQMVERRAAGEPLQYVLGRWGFRQLDLLVDRRVLIPRPETEQVVEVALAELAALSVVRPDPVVVDLGTGSGAIALSLALEGKAGAVWGTDCSEGAIATARANLAGLGGRAATRVRLSVGSWWEALPETLRGQVSLVVSNPPYLATAEMAALDPVVADWEPAVALDAGPSGSEAVQVVVSGAPDWLARPGTLVVELAPRQAAEVAALARRAGFDHVAIHTDLSGRDRALVGRLQ